MDQFSIPERMDPVARAENNARNTVLPDRRRRQAPPRPPAEDDDLPQDEEKSQNLDELA